jgi:uncharacterized iron-regulated membrane protein
MKTAKRFVLRDLWVQVHLWLGLTLGVLGVAIGITGSLLVYDDDLDAAFNPRRYAVSGAQAKLPPSEYLASAAKALEDRARPSVVRMPREEGWPVVVFARGKGDSGFSRVYLDPPTGRVLEVVAGGGFLAWAHTFHENLTLREYNGREIVGAVGIAMLISSLSGLYLWWPARGRFRAALGFRRGFTTTRNLHYFFGFYGALVLAMLSFTGIFLAYNDASRAVVAAFAPLSPPARNVQAPESPAGGKPLGVDAAVAIAQAAHPAERLWAVGLPAGPRGSYRVNLSEPGVPDMHPGRGNILFIDPNTGAVLRSLGPATRTGGDRFLIMQRLMHEGAVLGPPGRALIFITGLLPALFVVTGTLMWLRNRRQRQATRVRPRRQTIGEYS